MFLKIRSRRSTKDASEEKIAKTLDQNDTKNKRSSGKSIFRRNSPKYAPVIELSKTASMSEDEMDDASVVVTGSPRSLASSAFMEDEQHLQQNDELVDSESINVFTNKLIQNYEESLNLKDHQIHLTRKELAMARIELYQAQGERTDLIQELDEKQQELFSTQNELCETKQQLETVSSALIQCQHELFDMKQRTTLDGVLALGKGLFSSRKG